MNSLSNDQEEEEEEGFFKKKIRDRSGPLELKEPQYFASIKLYLSSFVFFQNRDNNLKKKR